MKSPSVNNLVVASSASYISSTNNQQAQTLYEARPDDDKFEINSVPESVSATVEKVFKLIETGKFQIQEEQGKREILLKTKLFDPEFKEAGVPVQIKLEISESEEETVQRYFTEKKKLLKQAITGVLLHEYAHTWPVERAILKQAESIDLQGIEGIAINLKLNKAGIVKSGRTFFQLDPNFYLAGRNLENKFKQLQAKFERFFTSISSVNQLKSFQRELEQARTEVNRLLNTSLVLLYSFLFPQSINQELGKTFSDPNNKNEPLISRPSRVDQERANNAAKEVSRLKSFKNSLIEMLRTIKTKIKLSKD